MTRPVANCFKLLFITSCTATAPQSHQSSSSSVQNRSSTSPAKRLVQASSSALQPAFAKIDERTQEHLSSVLTAFRENRVSSQTFLSADGYGHSDHGREVLDEVYANIFKCEAALVRMQFVSGTHAIAAVLYGVLRPGDELVVAAGPVYDTLEEVIGSRSSVPNVGNLKDWGIHARTIELRDGRVDVEAVVRAVKQSTQARMVLIQRSFGYAWRDCVSLTEIRRIVQGVRAVRDDVLIFVDNCYGEMVDEVEPVHPSIGADAMAGSLIKNLGGGIVPSGGYVAGREYVVRRAANRLAAPGVEGGATLGWLRPMFQGLFLAPGAIGEALKGSLLVAEVMSELGYDVLPERGRAGFVRAVQLGCEERVMQFCRAVQRNGPVGAFIEPTKGATAGYGDPVVFAQSTFVDGSTIELSADGPLREPYAVFAQGGLHWTHWALVLEDVVDAVGPVERNPRA